MDEFIRIVGEISITVIIVLIALCLAWGANCFNRRNKSNMPDLEDFEP